MVQPLVTYSSNVAWPSILSEDMASSNRQASYPYVYRLVNPCEIIRSCPIVHTCKGVAAFRKNRNMAERGQSSGVGLTQGK